MAAGTFVDSAGRTIIQHTCGHLTVFEGGDIAEKLNRPCSSCLITADASPLTHTATGMIIAAIERGVDVEARLAAWNEDELSEDEDW